MFVRIVLTLAILLTVHSQGYNQELAASLCHLSVAAYCSEQRLQTWTCEACINSQIKIENIQIFRNTSGESVGFIGTSASPSATFLIFRGAQPQNINRWYSGIDLNKVNYPICNNGCQVHREFYREYTDFSSRMMTTLKEYLSLFQKNKIIIAGHSLGGAFATFAALELQAGGIPVSELYTYGEPRLGDLRWTSWWDSYAKMGSKNRITHSHDSVPHIPSNLQGFLHKTHEIFYKGTVRQGYVSCSDGPIKQDGQCADKNFASVTLTDHLNYFDIDFSSVIQRCQ